MGALYHSRRAPPAPAGSPSWSDLLDRESILKRLRFRAWHRGTREADYMIGGFFDRYAQEWDATETAWFEALLHEDDVDIMAWAIGTQAVPARWAGPMMDALRRLDYIPVAR